MANSSHRSPCNGYTNPQANSSPMKKRLGPKRKVVFQPSILRCYLYVRFREGIYTPTIGLMSLSSKQLVVRTLNITYSCLKNSIPATNVQVFHSSFSVKTKLATKALKNREPKNTHRNRMNRGHYITNPNNALLWGKSLKITIHLHCLIPPRWKIE